MPSCSDCGGTVIEYDTAAGNGFCVKCGTVVEENVIVNEVSFGETGSGAAMVQGAFVQQGATGARMGGPFGNRGNVESREQTIANASKKIHSIAAVLRLSEAVCLSATRLYTLAVENKFTKGRRSMNVVAVCLYVACRQKETRNYMLIDFSDLLQVNVFELGHTYLQLVQVLNLRLPLVDPSHYISRFSALLEYGEETHRVATDAVRLVQRFDRDWMTRGRRPAGICGAALFLASRMNNFRRSVEEIVQVVKIADTTLKKRLEEFKSTPSGALTMEDFRHVWLEDEVDPPAFTKGKEKEEQLRQAGIDAEDPELWDDEKQKEHLEEHDKKKKKKKKRGKKRKRKDGDDTDEEDDEDKAPSEETLSEPADPARQPIDAALLNEGILSGTSQLGVPPEFQLDPDIDPGLQDMPVASSSTLVAPTESAVESSFSSAITSEVESFLHTAQGSELSGALEEAEQRRLALIAQSRVDELEGLDEEELDRFILTEAESKIKERVWVELNRDYLEALAAKGDQQNSDKNKSRKRRKTQTKPRDASTAHGNTAGESVAKLIKKNHRYSKRINYNALKDLFVDNGLPDFGPPIDLDDKADDMYHMDDKDDGEGGPVLVIEEEVSTPLAMAKDQDKAPSRTGPRTYNDDGDVEDDDDDDVSGWDEGYEQEV